MYSEHNFLVLIILIIFELLSVAQQSQINLKQGSLVGLKVFPDSSSSAVYAFLGVPYAQPPVKELRFAPPKTHSGWKGALLCMSMKPICPQLLNTIYDETTTNDLTEISSKTNEDCLYLNIWASEKALQNSKMPVLVVLAGEDMSYDWPRNRITGVDMAAEGFVIITIQYRTNIFGWFNVAGNNVLNGNFGLLDQSLALKWIKKNVESFGGNPNQITLLGHGTGGAPCAFYHSIFNNDDLSSRSFKQLILMSSGNIERAFQPVSVVQEASNFIIEKLGCQFEGYGKQLLQCLRSKSVSDLLKAFETVYENGTLRLGPSLTNNFNEIFSDSTIMSAFPTSVIGITSNEGALMQDYWLQLARDSYSSLRAYIENTFIKNMLPKQSQFNNSVNSRILDIINWYYFNEHFEENQVRLLAALQRFLSEYNYEIPFYKLLTVLSNATEAAMNRNKFYAYIYDFSNSMDVRGKINLFKGSSHSSDLPFLFGPTLFLQIARRRLNNEEEKLYRKIRTSFINFIQNGNPQPSENYENWIPYSSNSKFIYELGNSWSSFRDSAFLDSKNLHKIKQLLFKNHTGSIHSSNSYQMQKNKNNNRLPDIANVHNSPYIAHLIKVYRFWKIFLPELIATNSDNSKISKHLHFIKVAADAARFKQGFFLMLSLVLLLLALLCLCVYLVRAANFYSPQNNLDL